MNPLLIAILLTAQPAAEVAGPEESVQAGREALDRWWGDYPWYDAGEDGVRRVELREPWDFSWLPERSGRGSGGGAAWGLQWFAWIVIALLLIAGVWLLVRAYRTRSPSTSSAGAKKSSTAGPIRDRIEALPFSLGRGRRDLLAGARRYYREGNYAQAVIYLFSYQLIQLDKHKIIRLAKGKTNRQYLREVGPRSPLRQALEQTMVAFEEVFFGHRSLSRTRFEACWSRVDEFESLGRRATGLPSVQG